MAYEIRWSNEARADIRAVPVFRRGPIFAAIEQLQAQAEFQTRNRKPLVEPLEILPDATWEVRVGEHRVFYRIDLGQTVDILRVILKGGTTTAEAIGRGRKP